MTAIYVTRKIPEAGLKVLRDKGYEVVVNNNSGALTPEDFLKALKEKSYSAILSLLTDKIDASVFVASPDLKIVANYAVGYNNIDLEEAKKRNVRISNTPEVLTMTVAQHAFALLLSLASRVVEGDQYVRDGHFKGWEPELLLGVDVPGKTLGILGAGRIGSKLAQFAKNGFEMEIIYYDVNRNELLEKSFGARYMATPEELLKEADFVSVHVPLLENTRHLINAERLRLMKKTAYLINTSRGPVVDEIALVEALKEGVIAGAGLDVYEKEPELAPGLKDLPNVIITPHTASATRETRDKMAVMAAENIIAVLAGGEPINKVA